MSSLPQTEELNLLHNSICKALGDITRIQILYVLNNQPRNVTEISDSMGITQPSASRHLAVLRQSGLVTARREGPAVIYSLSDPRIIGIIDDMRTMLKDRLTHHVSLFE